MTCVQCQGVHHITLVGADRQTSIDFWEGVLGMPLVFEQPNLDAPDQNHLYFDRGRGGSSRSSPTNPEAGSYAEPDQCRERAPYRVHGVTRDLYSGSGSVA